MRMFPNAVQATIVALALYYVLTWGFEALWALTSPVYGLEDFNRSQIVYSLGRLFGFDGPALIRMAAFLATIKLAVAVVLTYHIVERVRALTGRPHGHDFLDAGLILATLLILGSSVAPLIESNSGLMRANAMDLLLIVALAIMTVIDRLLVSDLPALDERGLRTSPMPQTEPAYPAGPAPSLTDNIAPWLKRLVPHHPADPTS
jgi:hypothetical protein